MYVATDLHGHTLYSDARVTPAEFVAVRRAAGLRVIAISDHDCFAGVRAGAAAAEHHGMVLVPAAELTSMVHFGTEDVEQIHILGYFPPSFLQGERLEKMFLYQRGLEVQRKWRLFVLEWLRSLPLAARLQIDPQKNLDFTSPQSFPGLQSFLDRVVASESEHLDVFRKHHVQFWTHDADLFGWSPESLIEAIRADGGVDVVAHPVRYRDKERLDRVLAYASGVEVYTSRHNDRVAARFRQYAEDNHKLWTASVDDHQQKEYERPPAGTPLSTMERIFGGALPKALLEEERAVHA